MKALGVCVRTAKPAHALIVFMVFVRQVSLIDSSCPLFINRVGVIPHKP